MKTVRYLTVMAALVILGFAIGRVSTAGSEQVVLEPYNGLGSGVLKHGTVLKEDYKGPASVSGTLDIYGIWIIENE